jgi:protein phosphatase
VHGGLFHKEGITLANIAAVNRKRDIPFGYPGFEDKIFEDLMWSDPRASPNGTSESDRGAGVVFGPDVTARFCALNGVSLVVRSHECMPDGALFCHDGRLVTVFSASMYCGKTLNRGAVLRFNAKLEHIVTSWEAPNLADCTIAGDGPAESNRTRTDEDSKLASEAVNRMLIERIIIHKAVRLGVFAHARARRGGSADLSFYLPHPRRPPRVPRISTIILRV